MFITALKGKQASKQGNTFFSSIFLLENNLFADIVISVDRAECTVTE